MGLLDSDVKARDIIKLIDTRMDMVTHQYRLAKSNNEHTVVEAMVETKWQLATLKLQLADLLLNSIDEQQP